MLDVGVVVLGKGVHVDARYHIPDAIVLLQNGRSGCFYALVALNQEDLFLENGGSEIPDVLDLLLEVH